MRFETGEFSIFLRTLTARKIWNIAKIYSSFHLARLSKKPIHWGMPVTIGVEPTTACNLRCPQCISGLRAFTRPTGRLSLDRYKAIIDELHPDLCYLLLYFQGEPFLNPEFFDLVRYAADRRIFTATSTNAHFLDPERAERTVRSGLSRVIISLDGLTQETYAKYRIEGKVETVLQGIRNLVEARRRHGSRTPYINVQFIAFEHNRHEIDAVRQMSKTYGVDRVAIKTAQVYDFEQGSSLIPQDEKLSRYKRNPDGSYQIKNKLLNQCWKLWQGAEITWDGRVLPCCFDKDGEYLMGQTPEQPFKTIWRNDRYSDFRKKILSSRKAIAMCRNCTEGTKLWEN